MGSVRAFVVVLVAAATLAACTTESRTPAGTNLESVTPGVSETPTSSPAPTPTPSKTLSRALRFDTWVVGAQVLPRRPDGFGEIRPTPPQLRVRLLPTIDVLPPPTGGKFRATVAPVTRALVRRTDLAWSPSCPARLDELRYLTMSFWGFDARPHTGEMVVAASVAKDVVQVFRKLYAARFPLEQMTLVTRAGLDAPPTGDGNETSAYACRPSTGGTSWSAHAYGIAVDINPFNNPYTKGDVVLPELSSSYVDRSWKRPGMIYPGDVVTRAFADIGWTWGGTWNSLKDRHHFSQNGR
ncbi:MAG TPA: M15 family metallopeptidase [Nocardioidaceae bacterium]|nr:M15 family metallopeptidase [Nocardioidaceae bacterium]